MPALRLTNRRRRSSAMLSFNPAKPGVYGIGLPPPPPSKPVTFAPNVTPGTFVDPEDGSDAYLDPSSPSTALFPPSDNPAPPTSRRRVPPGKRRSLGYIPRPPNAFMLFRADFVRQKHVPGSIETNHGSLSKIIGSCWRALPLEEKRVWEVKAKHAKAEHKAKYPNYRFRPVHNKNKEKKKEKPQPVLEDERRCEEVAQLLLEGKKGEQLAEAVRNLDRLRSQTPVAHTPAVYPHRRSSSVPLPNDYYTPYTNIAASYAPFLLPNSRPTSPMQRQQRMMLGQQRRPSSAGPAFFRSWTTPNPPIMNPNMFQHDESHLPEPDLALLNTFNNFNFQISQDQQATSFNVNDLMTSLPPHEQPHDTHLGLGPLEPLGPQDILSQMYSCAPTPCDPTSSEFNNNSADVPDLDHWFSSSLQQHLDSQSPSSAPSSHTSSTYSGSPQPSDKSLPLPVFAPQPVRPEPTQANTMFTGMSNMGVTDVWSHADVAFGNDQLNLDFSSVNNMGCVTGAEFPFVSNGFDFGAGDNQMADFIKNEV